MRGIAPCNFEMGNRMREGDRQEKIIRGLLKLKENRRCMNCNSLGPQYVCTNFSTFICTTCSGVHREFTHRVKSISMSTFTAQDVGALHSGGNQRAREFFLREWDFKRDSLPESSNIDRLRDFIKKVYVERRYVGTNIVPRRRLVEDEEGRENSRAGPFSEIRVPLQKSFYENRFAAGRQLDYKNANFCEEDQVQDFKNGIYDNRRCNMLDGSGPRFSDVGQDMRESGYCNRQRRALGDSSGQCSVDGKMCYEDRPRWSVDHCDLPGRYSVDHHRQKLSLSRGRLEADFPVIVPPNDSNRSNHVTDRTANMIYCNAGRSGTGHPCVVGPQKNMHMASSTSFGNVPFKSSLQAQSDSLVDFNPDFSLACKKSCQFDQLRNIADNVLAINNGWITFDEIPEMEAVKEQANVHVIMDQAVSASANFLRNGTSTGQLLMEQSWNPFLINDPSQFPLQQQSPATDLQADKLGSLSCAQPWRSTNPFDLHATLDLFPDMSSVQITPPRMADTIESLSTQWSNTVTSQPTRAIQSIDAIAGGIDSLAQNLPNLNVRSSTMHLQTTGTSSGLVYSRDYTKQAGSKLNVVFSDHRNNSDIFWNSLRHGTNPFD